MTSYIVRRFLLMIPILIGITLITFLVMHLAPGKPTDILDFHARVDHDIRERFSKIYGLDKPLHEQYLTWLKKFFTLDFGKSFKDDRPVITKILERLPNTILLNLCSLGLIFLFSIPFGVLSAIKRGLLFDRLVTIFVFIGYAIPKFWLALILMIIFGIKLGILPLSGLRSVNFEFLPFHEKVLDIIKHLTLPVLISSFAGLAGLTRYVRASTIDVMNQDYVRYAYAKGLPKKTILFKHILRNVLIPVVTILGLSLPDLIGGSFIFETIFAYPGIGRLGYEAIVARDYPVIMGLGTIVAILTLLGNFIADIAYAYVDPRIRYK